MQVNNSRHRYNSGYNTRVQARGYLQSLPIKAKVPWSKLYPNADPKGFTFYSCVLTYSEWEIYASVVFNNYVHVMFNKNEDLPQVDG